jgi:hypothetical protein
MKAVCRDVEHLPVEPVDRQRSGRAAGCRQDGNPGRLGQRASGPHRQGRRDRYGEGRGLQGREVHSLAYPEGPEVDPGSCLFVLSFLSFSSFLSFLVEFSGLDEKDVQDGREGSARSLVFTRGP